MSGLNDEMSLAEKLCGELLTAADLRQLCVARGFPIAGTAKDDLARSAAVRLLDPRGVREAMTKLDPLWLKVLHLIAASRKPLSLDPIAKLVEPNVNVWKLDYRALWRKVVAGLLVYGVALVHESAVASHSKSRFARFELVLPNAFRPALPPFPMQVEAISSAPTRGTLDELLEAALRSFIEQTSSVGMAKPDTLVQRVAAELELKSGIFKLRDIQHPTRELLTAAVRDIWLKGLLTRSRYPAGTIASVAHHILGSLPEGTGCVASTLAAQLAEFGFQTKLEEVASFVDDGICWVPGALRSAEDRATSSRSR